MKEGVVFDDFLDDLEPSASVFSSTTSPLIRSVQALKSRESFVLRVTLKTNSTRYLHMILTRISVLGDWVATLCSGEEAEDAFVERREDRRADEGMSGRVWNESRKLSRRDLTSSTRRSISFFMFSIFAKSF